MVRGSFLKVGGVGCIDGLSSAGLESFEDAEVQKGEEGYW